jgi:hypothetical protein
MSDPSRPDDRARRKLSPVGVVKAFFTHDVQLRRDGRNLHLELVPRGTAAPELARVAGNSAEPRFDNLPMYQALKALLDPAPDSRRTLRHLAAVERQLLRRGCLHLEKLTLPALEVLLRQFDGLVEPPLSQPLAELRAQIVAALALQRRQQQEAERAQQLAAAEAAAAEHMEALSALLGEKLEVSEGTPTDFQRVASS